VVAFVAKQIIDYTNGAPTAGAVVPPPPAENLHLNDSDGSVLVAEGRESFHVCLSVCAGHDVIICGNCVRTLPPLHCSSASTAVLTSCCRVVAVVLGYAVVYVVAY